MTQISPEPARELAADGCSDHAELGGGFGRFATSSIFSRYRFSTYSSYRPVPWRRSSIILA